MNNSDIDILGNMIEACKNLTNEEILDILVSVFYEYNPNEARYNKDDYHKGFISGTETLMHVIALRLTRNSVKKRGDKPTGGGRALEMR